MRPAKEMIGDGSYPKNAKDAVERWDKGEIVWTIAMGGMGPGYEQAIQVLMIELLRSFCDTDLPEDEAALNKLFDDEATNIIKSSGGGLSGMSGAQVGAAKQIAYGFLTKGWLLMDEAPDQGIMVSKEWPRCEPQEIGLGQD